MPGKPSPSRSLPDKQSPSVQESKVQESDTQNLELEQNYEKLVERFYTLISDPYGFEDIDKYGEFGVIEAARTMEGDALDGMTHRLTVEVSGEDGSLILGETY